MRRLAHRGFTLLELLVALAVLAVLASVTVRGLGSILDAEAHVRAEARRWSDVARVMEQLSRDLSLATEGPMLDDSGQLLITRLGELDDAIAEAGPRRVGYRLRDGVLEYLTWPSATRAEGAVPAASVVLDRIATLQLRALGPEGEWQFLRPAARQGGALPRAIEAQIRLADGERISRVFPLR